MAEVKEGAKDRDAVMRVNGREAIEIVYKEGDGNTVAVAANVREALERLQDLGDSADNGDLRSVDVHRIRHRRGRAGCLAGRRACRIGIATVSAKYSRDAHRSAHHSCLGPSHLWVDEKL